MVIIIFSIIVLLFSTIIHEIAHGTMAYRLGDSTAKDAGRLTLNPLKHLDFVGSFMVPLFLLVATLGRGPILMWAKPVPINPYNFRDQKWGTIKVSLIGPAMNFLLAIIFGLAIRFLDLGGTLALLFGLIVIYNFIWGIFNLIPIPPLDGSWVLLRFLPKSAGRVVFSLQQYGLIILLAFIFFGGLDWVFRVSAILFTLITGRIFI